MDKCRVGEDLLHRFNDVWKYRKPQWNGIWYSENKPPWWYLISLYAAAYHSPPCWSPLWCREITRCHSHRITMVVRVPWLLNRFLYGVLCLPRWYWGYGLGVSDLFMDAEFLTFDTVRFMKNVVHVPSMPAALYERKQGDTEATDTVGRMCCSE